MAEKKTPKGAEPKRFSKSEISFNHDLYKAELSTMVKNVHYKKYEHKFEEIEHVHFFHSVSNRGKPQTHCSFVGGHTHEVETYVDEKGNLKAKCGPPIHKVWKNGPGGKGRMVWEKIEYYNGFDADPVRVDDHTHEMTYKGSEEITLGSMSAGGAAAMNNYPQARAQALIEQSAALGAKYATDLK